MEGQRAFSGIRVLDISQGVVGSYCTKFLADFGAEVIKIEPPGGESGRSYGPFPDDTADPERSALFLHLNTNKKSVTLDLRSSRGRDALRRLVGTADVVVENSPPGTFESMSLSYDDLAV